MHYALRIKHYFVPLQPITNIETMFCEHLSAEVIYDRGLSPVI